MEHAQSILSLTGPPVSTTTGSQALGILKQLIPYLILLLNYVLFQLLRSFVGKLFSYRLMYKDRTAAKKCHKLSLLKLLIDELISTCELCADCAELNVVYEKHGSLAYGVTLFILSYVWIEAFGDAHTTPGYLTEEFFLDKGSELLKTGDTYARFIGQTLAMPLAWRFAALYWRYHLLSEHSSMLEMENCRSSLTTSSWNGFMIEFTCCFISRLAELCGHKLLERKYLSQRVVSGLCSFICSSLVVLTLELSGGYFNPILAASLEYGCKGIKWHQHALVFWLGPLSGHVLARALFKCYGGERLQKVGSIQHGQLARTAGNSRSKAPQTGAAKRTQRTSPRKKSCSDKVD